MKYNTLDDFLLHQKELIELEHKTEVEQQTELYESKSLKHLENKGLCVRSVFVEHHKTGMFGRFVVTFSLKEGAGRDKDDNSSAHGCKFTPGMVCLCI